jgi:methylated-DNA-[protein]-cysteine S-methyltransferase
VKDAPALKFATFESPFGAMFLAATERGVVRVGFPEEVPERIVEELEMVFGAPAERAPMSTERREIDAYFAGGGRIGLAADLSLAAPGFSTKVLEATRRIPYGSVSTYGDVAKRAGSPRAARAAGNALNSNPVPIVVPCHRVVPASGGIGGYGGNEERKAFLLRLEGTLTEGTIGVAGGPGSP